MSENGFTLFETSIGACAIAWTAVGIRGVQLPESDVAATRRRARHRFGSSGERAPPRSVELAVAGIVALMGGEPVDLAEISLDLEGVAEFDRRVYAAARRIGPGHTRTYGEVAESLGDATLARAVGQSLGRNPFAIIVPCHRVLAADGRLGGFSAPGGAATKRRLLLIEGARAGGEPDLFDLTYG